MFSLVHFQISSRLFKYSRNFFLFLSFFQIFLSKLFTAEYHRNGLLSLSIPRITEKSPSSKYVIQEEKWNLCKWPNRLPAIHTCIQQLHNSFIIYLLGKHECLLCVSHIKTKSSPSPHRVFPPVTLLKTLCYGHCCVIARFFCAL